MPCLVACSYHPEKNFRLFLSIYVYPSKEILGRTRSASGSIQQHHQFRQGALALRVITPVLRCVFTWLVIANNTHVAVTRSRTICESSPEARCCALPARTKKCVGVLLSTRRFTMHRARQHEEPWLCVVSTSDLSLTPRQKSRKKRKGRRVRKV